MKVAQTWDVLLSAIKSITYVDDSLFELVICEADNHAVLYVYVHAPNSYRADRADRYTRHEFIVPVATYNRANWIRWVYECLKGIAIHEVCEWFQVDGVRVYAPHHGDGENPYVEWQLGTDEDASKAPGE